MRTRTILPILVLALFLTPVVFGQVPPSIGPAVTEFTDVVGTPFSQTFTCVNCGVGVVFTWSITAGSLPSGLSLNSATGVVSGTPTAAQGLQFTITASLPTAVIASGTYTFVTANPNTFLTTSPLAPVTAGTPATRTIQVSVSGIWAVDQFDTLPSGVTLNLPPKGGTTASISGTFPTVTTPTSYVIQLGVFDQVQTITQTFSITANPAPALSSTLVTGEVGVAYSGTLSVTGGTSPFTFSLTNAGTFPPGLSLNPNTGAITGTPTQSGTFTFPASVTDTNGAVSASRFTINVTAAPSITTASLPSGQVNSAYSATLGATGGTPGYTWAVSAGSLPAGLTLNPATGVIAGTPTTVGTFPFTIRVTDSLNISSTQALSIGIVPTALTITTTSLANATQGQPYSATLAASGGNPPYTWSLSSGQLPPGLTLNSNGTITGTVSLNAAASYNFTVQVSDTAIVRLYASATATQPLTLVVNPSALTITTTSLPNATQGQPYSATLAASGGNPPYAWTLSAGQLPPGLTLNSNGTIAGTVSLNATASYNFTVQVSDTPTGRSYSGATATQALTLVVNPPVLTITTSQVFDATRGVPFKQTLTASGGVPPYSWSLVSGQLAPGLTLSSRGTISGTTNAAPFSTFTFTVQVTDSSRGESRTPTRTFTMGVVQPQLTIGGALPTGVVGQAYSAVLSATGGNGPYTFVINSGQLPPGLTLAASGAITGTPTSSGSFSFVAQANDTAIPGVYLGSSATGSFTITINPATLTIPITPLPTGVLGQSYGATLTATGGAPPYSWSVTGGSLPPGISFTSVGSFAGTPTSVGSSNFTVTVRDSQGQSASQSFSIAVTAGLVIASPILSDGEVQVPYHATLTVSGGTAPFSFSVTAGSLPAGLTLSSTGAISGTPTTAGTFTFTAGVTDSKQVSGTEQATLVIHPPVQLPAAALPNGTRSNAYTTTLSASGGVPPYAFSLSSGSLPGGLTLSAGGSISGTPTSAGTSSFTAQVTDQAGGTATGTFSLKVSDIPGITPSSLPAGSIGTAYSATLSATGVAPLQWSITGGALPNGLSLNGATGAITGTPTKAGSFTFTVGVSDSSTPPLNSSQTYTVSVQLPTLPAVTVTQLPNTVNSGSQPAFGVGLGESYPVPLTGVATLSFVPVSGPGDPAIVFSNGTTTMFFTILAGQTLAISPADTPLALQTGTTAGTGTISIVLSAGEQTLNPNPAATETFTIAPAAPVISSVQLSPTSAGLNVVITGYSNTREVSGLSFQFNANAGSSLATSQFSVPVTSVFQSWFGSDASANFGGQFVLTVPFTVSQGAVAGLASVQVTLTNSVGPTSATGTF